MAAITLREWSLVRRRLNRFVRTHPAPGQLVVHANKKLLESVGSRRAPALPFDADPNRQAWSRLADHMQVLAVGASSARDRTTLAWVVAVLETCRDDQRDILIAICRAMLATWVLWCV